MAGCAPEAGLTAENPYRYLITQYLASAEEGRCAIVAFSHDTVGESPEKLSCKRCLLSATTTRFPEVDPASLGMLDQR